MKYIPAEKLIAEIERQNVDKKVIEPLIRIITSLQQEQPEDTENKQKPVVQWPNLSNCKHNCKTCFAKCFYRKEQNEEKQPEVDLEKEIWHWMDKLDDKYCILVEDYPIQDIKDTAHHFYELGRLNARKEE